MPRELVSKRKKLPPGFSSVALDISTSEKPCFSDIYIDFKIDGSGAVYCRTQMPSQNPIGRHRKLSLSKDDFDDEYSSFQKLEQITANNLTSNLLRDLAETGYELFREIFTPEEAIEISNLNEQIAASNLASSNTFAGDPSAFKRIFVSAERLNIPWELLYIENPISEFDTENTEIDPSRFLGYHFFIHQDFQDRTNLHHYPLPFDKERGATIFVDQLLPYAFAHEAPAIQTEFTRMGSQADIFEPLLPFTPFGGRGDRKEGRNGRQLSKRLRFVRSDILHFACHSNQTDHGVQLRLEDRYHLTEIEIRRSFPKSSNGAFLVFNSCDMAVWRPSQYNQFLRYLAAKGFSGIIATEIKVKDSDASKFAKVLYREFANINVGSIQKAMFRARRRLLFETGSFVGFTYSFYGNHDLIIGEN